MSAATLKVLAADQKKDECQHQPTGRQPHYVGGEALPAALPICALTTWIAIMNGVVRNTVQSSP